MEPVNYYVWAAAVVIVKKANGKFRVCNDCTAGLNDSLDANPYPHPEDLFTKLNGEI